MGSSAVPAGLSEAADAQRRAEPSPEPRAAKPPATMRLPEAEPARPGVRGRRRLASGRQLAKAEEAQRQQSGSFTVYLNVYDVTRGHGVRWLNSLTAHELSPLRLGAFHVGVQVGGREWSFGHHPCDSGVSWSRPRSQRDHQFRESVQMEDCMLSQGEILALLEKMRGEYGGQSYDMLTRNCCHFADDLCRRMGVGAVPEWIQRLPRMGGFAAETLQTLALDLGAPCFSRTVADSSPQCGPLPRSTSATFVCGSSPEGGVREKPGTIYRVEL